MSRCSRNTGSANNGLYQFWHLMMLWIRSEFPHKDVGVEVCDAAHRQPGSPAARQPGNRATAITRASIETGWSMITRNQPRACNRGQDLDHRGLVVGQLIVMQPCTAG